MTIKEIIAKKEEIIALKKLETKHSDSVLNRIVKDLNDETIKRCKPTTKDGVEIEEAEVKIVANTYYWLDSHDDVHVKGCFTKSINENKGRIYHLDNHNHDFNSIIGKIKDIQETEVNWSDLGIDKQGKTICVIATSLICEDYNCKAFEMYIDKTIYNHSVGMQYVNLKLAVNDNSEEYKEEYALWNEVYPMLGNPEKADLQGYFWVVKEAKLKEVSALLWDGSNDLTPILEVNIEPSDDTQTENKETIKITQEEPTVSKTIINLNLY